MVEIKRKRIKVLREQLKNITQRISDAELLYGDDSDSYKSAVIQMQECKVLIEFHIKHAKLMDKLARKARG
ncbi:MAG TPA: hypothetical protein GX707_20890 [Epulopiscium sp.]|nr:hypothetical protein [Candidatus Epulonipiscium sp.]